MKRIDIDRSTNYNFISGLNIRPSVKKRIEDALYYKKFYYTRDLCKRKEEDLYEIPDIDENIVNEIKAKLLEAGLHFGMTDEQLDAYLDADFLAEKEKKKRNEEENDKEEDVGTIRGKGPVQTLVISSEKSIFNTKLFKVLDFIFEIVLPILTMAMIFTGGWFFSKYYYEDKNKASTEQIGPHECEYRDRYLDRIEKEMDKELHPWNEDNDMPSKVK